MVFTCVIRLMIGDSHNTVSKERLDASSQETREMMDHFNKSFVAQDFAGQRLVRAYCSSCHLFQDIACEYFFFLNQEIKANQSLQDSIENTNSQQEKCENCVAKVQSMRLGQCFLVPPEVLSINLHQVASKSHYNNKPERKNLLLNKVMLPLENSYKTK